MDGDNISKHGDGRRATGHTARRHSHGLGGPRGSSVTTDATAMPSGAWGGSSKQTGQRETFWGDTEFRILAGRWSQGHTHLLKHAKGYV